MCVLRVCGGTCVDDGAEDADGDVGDVDGDAKGCVTHCA